MANDTKKAVVERIRLDDLDLNIDDERLRRFNEILNEAMVKLALRSEGHRDSRNHLGVGSMIEYELLSMAVIEAVDEGIDTMCVELKGDGILRLRMNIDFVIKHGVEITMRGMAHEMIHIEHPIFFVKGDGNIDFLADWMKDELFKSQALEYWNNALVMKKFGDKSMLDVGDAGEPIGLMDPDKAYAKYREYKKSVNEDPVSREQFVLTPEVCYGYLKEMPKPPKQRHSGFCNHDRGEGGGQGDGSPGGIDMDEAETIMDQILDQLMGRALRGDEAARDALLDVGEMLGGEGSKFWSDMGLGQLMGKKLPPTKVRFWEHFLQSILGSMLAPGMGMVWPKKLAGADPYYRAVGSGIPLMAVGKEPEKKVWLFFDTSGSIPQGLVERCANLTGQIQGCEVKYHTFTTEVVPLDDITNFEYSRGGTSFVAIDEYVQRQDELPDCILIVTDGYAEKIRPSWSDISVWVITEDGDAWPGDYGMECVVTDIPAVDQ